MTNKSNQEKKASLTGHQKDWGKITKDLDILRKKIFEKGINENNWSDIRKDFVKIWNIKRISEMTLEEYTDTNRRYSFTYWIENVLDKFGNIHGSTSIKFGVYLGSDGKYKWKKSLGDDESEAFKVVRETLKNIINFSSEGNLENIDNIWELSPMFKWKVAFLYNGENNNILSIYSGDKLLEICKNKKILIDGNKKHFRLYNLLLDKKNNNIDVFQYSNSLWDSKGNIIETSDAILLRYKYFDENYNGEEVIIEHKEMIENNGYCLWGIFDTKFDSNIIIKNQYGFLLSTSPDGINILHMFKIEDLLLRKDLSEEGVKHIPLYYRNNDEINYYLKINQNGFKQVPLSYLDLYSTINSVGEIKSNLRNSLKGQTSLFSLKLNKENIINLNTKIDFFKNSDINIVRSIKNISGVAFKNYYGLKNLYINFSSKEKFTYDFEKNSLIRIDNSNNYDIFKEYGIDNLTCIVGKNGSGKSRIIQSILNYINDWQKLNKSNNRTIEKEDFIVFFEDEYGNLIQSNSNSYLFKQVISTYNKNEKNYNINYKDELYDGVLDFSNMVNIFISDAIINPGKLEDNKLFYYSNSVTENFMSYIYGGSLNSNNYNKIQDIENNSIILSSILLNFETRTIFTDVLEDIDINFNFNKIKFNNNIKYISGNNLKKLLIDRKNITDIKIQQLKKEGKRYDKINNNSCKSLFKILFNGNGKALDSESAIDKQEHKVGVTLKAKIKFLNLKGPFGKFLEGILIDKENKLDELNNVFNEHNINNSNLDKFHYEILSNFLSLLIKSKTVTIDFLNDKNLNYSELSSGERNIIGIVAKVIYGYYYNDHKNLNIYFDEPDTYLHPEWQRRFINSLSQISLKIKNLKNNNTLNKNTEMNYFLTTHSPIIISDIPRNNLVGIEKGKIKEIKNETFLSNIYDILSSGFFMDNYIGEFSKNILENKLKERDELFSEVVGDEIIRSSFINKIKENEKN